MHTTLDFSELYDRDGLRSLHSAYNVCDRTFTRYESQGLQFIELAGKHWYRLNNAREFALGREKRRNPRRGG
jgi:hypothetical protein